MVNNFRPIIQASPRCPNSRGAAAAGAQTCAPRAAAHEQHGRHSRRGAARIGKQMSRAQMARRPLRRFENARPGTSRRHSNALRGGILTQGGSCRAAARTASGGTPCPIAQIGPGRPATARWPASTPRPARHSRTQARD
eukprot:2209707-Pyramimonas_sp.AAC.1